MKWLTSLDAYTRECLAMASAGWLRADAILDRVAELWVTRGVPRHMRSDTGPECTAKAVQPLAGRVGVHTLCIPPGSPWESGSRERFNGPFRDDLVYRDLVAPRWEVLVERWWQPENRIRPHRTWGYRPLAPEAIVPRCA